MKRRGLFKGLLAFTGALFFHAPKIEADKLGEREFDEFLRLATRSRTDNRKLYCQVSPQLKEMLDR